MSGITLREAVEPEDVERYWDEMALYFERDMQITPEDEDYDYFLGGQQRLDVEEIHERDKDRCSYIFFCRDGADIGFALPVIYASEDGKCLVAEFCVFPEYRGGGTGTACAKALLRWAVDNGAAYVELNNSGDARRERFWRRLGFVPNGTDEWGNPLMILPPKKDVPFTVERLVNLREPQLRRLLRGFRAEIGEEPLDDAALDRLLVAMGRERIAFFVARRGSRIVGMCSVARCFSTFACGETGVLDDFFIEPAFRKRGIARMLMRAAQDYGIAEGMASLTVCCAPCDEGMYQSLGFDTRLGATYAHLTE